jgi:transcriptional regulator with XRE-family HTH domain
MKRHDTPLSPEIPEDLRAYLENVPAVSPEDVARLAAAAELLDEDPSFQAEFLKSIFVEKMIEALKERGESQSELARRWGKTRQYVSKLFNEDKRVNFTIETMCEMAHQVGLRLDLCVLMPDQTAQPIGRGSTKPRALVKRIEKQKSATSKKTNHSLDQALAKV